MKIGEQVSEANQRRFCAAPGVRRMPEEGSADRRLSNAEGSPAGPSGAVTVGKKVSVRPQTFGKGAMEGTVTYIHPQGRFAMVEFRVRIKAPWWADARPAVIRECFQLARK